MAAQTSIGEIYELTQTHAEPIYIQLVALDPVNLNSDVVVVFKPGTSRENGLDETSLLFYTHTTVSQGIKEEIWQKAGKQNVHLDISKLKFKNYYGTADTIETPETPPPPYWTTWAPNDEEWHYVSEKEGMEIHAENGGIYPASDVLYRIENGRSEFVSNWPQ